MKAGIYITPNGNLIYVAKDRTIKATSLSPSTWPGTKASHRSSDDTVVIENTDYRCTRFADVPNGGVFNPQAVVDRLAAENAQAKEVPALEVDTTPSPAPLADGESARLREDQREHQEAITKVFALPVELQQQAGKTERLIGKHPALGMGYRIGVSQHVAQSVNAAQQVQQIEDNLRSQGYVPVEGTDEWVKEGADPYEAFASTMFGNAEKLDKAMAARGFVNIDGMYVGSQEAVNKLSDDRMNGRAADLEGSGAYTFGPAISTPQTDEFTRLRQRFQEAREATLRLSTNTYGSAPVQPPPMSAFDVGYSDPATCLAALKAGKFRLCHAASARKHRKKKDRHVWWHPVFGCYAWRKTA